MSAVAKDPSPSRNGFKGAWRAVAEGEGRGNSCVSIFWLFSGFVNYLRYFDLSDILRLLLFCF